MAISIKGIFAWLKSHYDKVFALVVLAILIGSLSYLAVRVSLMHEDKKVFAREIKGYKPRFPHATDIDTKAFDLAQASLDQPAQLTSLQWTNSPVFTPEKRVWCPECRKPKPYDALKCPFCGAEDKADVIPPDRDSDHDGMPDVWEMKYGLNPFDPSDADKDLDGDGFTNLEEYRAGTDPTDPNSHPSIVSKLRVIRVDRDPFMLLFKSVIVAPDKSLTFGLNLRSGERTFFAKLGDVLKPDKNDKVGFKLLTYEHKIAKQMITGIGERDVDASVLKLQRGDKIITLVINHNTTWNEYTAQLMCVIDNSRYQVKIGSVLDLKGMKFKVLNIVDTKPESVLIEAVQDGEKTTIEKFPETKAEGSGEPAKNISPKPAGKQGESPL